MVVGSHRSRPFRLLSGGVFGRLSDAAPDHGLDGWRLGTAGPGLAEEIMAGASGGYARIHYLDAELCFESHPLARKQILRAREAFGPATPKIIRDYALDPRIGDNPSPPAPLPQGERGVVQNRRISLRLGVFA